MLTEQDIDRLVDGSYTESYSNELAGLLNAASSITPLNTILEIGVCFGGTLRVWEHSVPPGGKIIGVDKNPNVIRQMTGLHIAGQTSCAGNGMSNNWVLEHNYGNVHKFQSDREVYVVIGDASSPEVAEVVENILGGSQIDMIFHDGIHYGPGPIYDYANFQHHFRLGGLLAIADVCDIAGQPPIDNLGTAALYHSLPEPKCPAVEPRRAGIATWVKQDFELNPARATKEQKMSYFGYGPTGAECLAAELVKGGLLKGKVHSA